MKKTIRIIVLFILFTAFSHLAFAASKDIPEHEIIKFFPNSECQGAFKNFDAYQFLIDESGKKRKQEIRGKYWSYKCKTDESVSRLELIENYKLAALEKGGEILSEDYSSVVFTVPTSEGGSLWSHLRTGGNGAYQLYIVEEKALDRKLKFGAEQMQHELMSKGYVTLYGINFDFDKATLQPGAGRVLIEVVKLLQHNVSLEIEIQGHTDNLGGDQYNLDLSQRRADTVKDFLVRGGIEAQRLSTKGHGLSNPVASNETEQGRAKNRRVVLVKIK